jgi:hypothetical protein
MATMNGSGVKQNTGWIGAGSGFLVLDRNGDGVIDNGSEQNQAFNLQTTQGAANDELFEIRGRG